mgnify:CR=1 FL=1
MTPDAPLAPLAALAVEELRKQFPDVPLWFGLHTRSFWALVQVAGSPRLVEAITPQELAAAIRAPWAWPWPSQ